MRIGASGCTCSSYVVHVVISECVFLVLEYLSMSTGKIRKGSQAGKYMCAHKGQVCSLEEKLVQSFIY